MEGLIIMFENALFMDKIVRFKKIGLFFAFRMYYKERKINMQHFYIFSIHFWLYIFWGIE